MPISVWLTTIGFVVCLLFGCVAFGAGRWSGGNRLDLEDPETKRANRALDRFTKSAMLFCAFLGVMELIIGPWWGVLIEGTMAAMNYMNLQISRRRRQQYYELHKLLQSWLQ